MPEEDTPYGMWLRGELEDYLHLPELFSTEVIDGEIVVSRAPAFGRDRIIHAIIFAFNRAKVLDESFSWLCSSTGLDMVGIEAGYIPDLIILDEQISREALQGEVRRRLVSDQVEMAVEVTSPSNAKVDRCPAKGAEGRGKWRGYARCGVPYYLLVDRDPRIASAVLYSIPDSATGAYLQEESWKFGEEIELPGHFGVTISTDEWLSWDFG
ncbi:Uma2 family endonuclease [Actinocorallia sp. B10E7]|uniref:Uma2 family endonuclease n=1 Tax=Actinocorallia sp. B10E7 TaxID=3153558 RepID=UPI00325E0010